MYRGKQKKRVVSHRNKSRGWARLSQPGFCSGEKRLAFLLPPIQWTTRFFRKSWIFKKRFAHPIGRKQKSESFLTDVGRIPSRFRIKVSRRPPEGKRALNCFQSRSASFKQRIRSCILTKVATTPVRTPVFCSGENLFGGHSGVVREKENSSANVGSSFPNRNPGSAGRTPVRTPVFCWGKFVRGVIRELFGGKRESVVVPPLEKRDSVAHPKK